MPDPGQPTEGTSADGAHVADVPRAGATPRRPGAALRSALDAAAAAWPRVDRPFYAAFSTACVLFAASAFYSSLHRQTGGSWSAPLDDVFIHFDYARATARGYPFQWSEGNGYSSGNTSLTYPFVLALGYLVGFRGLALMHWAAIVAVASTTAFLVGAGRLLEPLGRWAKYLLPPAVLSLGALCWTLFSGMENAFHLAVWALATLLALAIGDAGADARRRARRGFIAGAASALLCATRPESAVCVAALGLFAAWATRRALVEVLGHAARFRREVLGPALATALRVGSPAALVLAVQAGANRFFTGEWSQAGAIAKLAVNNPYMTGDEKLADWIFHLKYVVLRSTQHHFAESVPWGWLVPAVALLPLAHRRLRPYAILLWAQVVAWGLVVALNGQVRWQNERYVMPAIAWLLVLAAMGTAVLVARGASLRGRWLARVGLAAALIVTYAVQQAPNVRDQVWFFGRASRNILHQQVLAGQLLGALGAQRVLVGDAGALLYASDRPGIDLIGLGGYRDLPFARAGVHGLGASLELLERIEPRERPDLMALYPGWWSELPVIFGKRLAAVPVVGNVICGGPEKVIYRADWSPLDREGKPRSLRSGESVVDALDVADLVDERAHRYVFPRPSQGFVGFRVLPDPADARRDLFDAGRLIPHGATERARMRAPRAPGRLIARTASTNPARVEVRAAGRVLGHLDVRPARGWAETSIELPGDLPAALELELTPIEGEWTNHHLWIVEGGAPGSLARDARE